MNTGDLVKYGLLGAAGYLAYNYVTKSHMLGGAAGAAHPAVTEPPAQPQPSVLNTRDLVLAAARSALHDSTAVDFSNELLNWWEWCVFYNKVRGEGACDKVTVSPADPARRISIDEFWAAAKAGGLSGCAGGPGCGLGGLGLSSLPSLEAWRELMYSSGFVPNPWVT